MQSLCRKTDIPSEATTPFGLAWGHANRYTYIHACMHAYIHTYIHTGYIHTYMHACMHAYMHAYIHTYIHTYILLRTGENLILEKTHVYFHYVCFLVFYRYHMYLIRKIHFYKHKQFPCKRFSPNTFHFHGRQRASGILENPHFSNPTYFRYIYICT